MNKDVLSQQEIDALLRQNGDDDGTDTNSDDIRLNEHLSDFETDALGEIGNISFGTAATALSTLLRQKVDITTPKVSAVLRSQLSNDFPLPHVAIKVEYTDGFIGANVLAIRVEDAQIIADLMMGGDGTTAPSELNELHLSAVAEAMNQMMGSASTSMSTIFNMMVNITPPIVDVMDFDNKQSATLFPNDEVLIKISFRLIIGTLIDSHIMQLVPIAFAKDMISKLTGGMDDPAASEPAPQPVAAAPVEPTPVAATPAPQPMYEAPVAQSAQGHYPPPQPNYPQQPMYAEQPPAGYPQYPPQYPPQPYAYPQYPPQYPPQGYPPGYMDPALQAPANQPRPVQQNVNVQPAQFASFDASDITGAQGNLDLLLDIPLSITVELGRTKKLIRDILELVPGSIVQLDKLAGDPVDIMVNNKLVAKGEVVVIDENFGVRVTDIISPAERVRKLQ
ncbi:flagellar motor switch phosphatase FliY [Tumebacillus permanentifrigoris]|nr:flagellar motor switch phosphatase FliY [Tumebacillus permanentifrigoris]